MTYNFIFVRDIIKTLTYCDKHKFCNETFINPQKLKDCVTNEMSREISKGTKDYADNVLMELEATLEEALKTIQNNRRELK